MWQPVPYQPTAHTPLPQPLFDPSQPPPPFAHPPPDAALVARITKLAEYIARNGPQFVDLIRTKQGDNPDYAFLRGGPGSDYYHWYLHCTVFKRDPSLPSMPNHPHPTHYPMQQQPMAPRPPGVPRPPPPALGPSLPPHPALPPDIDHTCLYVLHALDGSQESVQATASWFASMRHLAAPLSAKTVQYMQALPHATRRLHVLYLANDILFAGHQPRATAKQGPQPDALAAAFTQQLPVMVAAAHELGDAHQQATVARLVEFWGQRGCIPTNTASALLERLHGPSAEPPAPFDPRSFPPGLLPSLLEDRDLTQQQGPYAPLKAGDVEAAGLPDRPEPTPLLSKRVDQFYAELKEHRVGQSRAEYVDERREARRAAGLPEEDVATGAREAGGVVRQGGKMWGGQRADDGSFKGADAGRATGLGFGNDGADDVYNSYRKIRSGAYHAMIVEGRPWK